VNTVKFIGRVYRWETLGRGLRQYVTASGAYMTRKTGQKTLTPRRNLGRHKMPNVVYWAWLGYEWLLNNGNKHSSTIVACFIRFCYAIPILN
jgi:hypothetical protein